MVRERIVAYFGHTGQRDWESVLQQVNIDLNLAGGSALAVHECGDLSPSNTSVSDKDE
jgi:hypothetical protein